MAKSNKQSYENKWQKTFEEAEVRPSAQLWKSIESDLNAAQNTKFKRRLLFYRSVAAAAVACLVVLGVYTWSNEFGTFTNDERKITATEQNSIQENKNTPVTDPEALAENEDNSEGTETENSASTSAETVSPLAEALEENIEKANEGEIANTSGNQLQTADNINKIDNDASTTPLAEQLPVLPDESNEKEVSGAQSPDQQYPEKNLIAQNTNILLSIAMIAPQGMQDSTNADKSLDNPVDEIYPIPIMPKDRKKDFQPVFFASVNLSTDYFNPNYNASPAGQALNVAPNAFLSNRADAPEAMYSLGSGQYDNTGKSNNSALGEENTAQLSFSYGANFGMAISEHWTLESGIAYSKYNTTSQTSAAYQGISAEEVYPVSLANNSTDNARQFSAVQYEPTDLTNTFDFVAVPLKVAYNLSFDKITVVLGTGAAANFLLQNSISDEAGQLNDVIIRPDDNSPFRKIYYSGILSGGIHYELMQKYAFTITPSYNFSISSLTKSGSNFMSLPYTFGIDFGIRYQF